MVPCLTQLCLHVTALHTKRNFDSAEIIDPSSVYALPLVNALLQELFVIHTERSSHPRLAASALPSSLKLFEERHDSK